MIIEKYYSLKKFNTFGINTYTRYFTIVKSINDFKKIFHIYKSIPKMILGNGSNILFLKEYYPGLVIKMEIKGIKIVYENKFQVIIKANCGENWDDLVKWTIKNEFNGLENLSFIPGTVGVAPIQNIGAYGSEIKDILLKVRVYEIKSKKIIEFSNIKCEFGYRNSFFKKNFSKNKYIVLSVFFILRKKKYHKYNLSYLALQKELNLLNIKKPNSNDIIKIILSMRNKKIPHPKKIGNAGSFFMNPIIKKYHFKKLKINHPNIIGYPIYNNKNEIKISASHLIEYTGWKGIRIGDVGISEKNPIILLNYGLASGMDIFYISEKIIFDIKKKFGIYLSREVEIIDDFYH
ncbi:UDP-N-acetylmuramate dehydrogenase [Blattabacterium cuenoti]|uniref:UDP-N-acetylmuramate dehydrogenase n=1 Tax=Blattabacterium cuenoti TaxID=1653831 RepID=UPI00163C80DA|nr:UDP-N-acetylmuramate dehydrogenase [Blattabacterium cuenoti]